MKKWLYALLLFAAFALCACQLEEPEAESPAVEETASGTEEAGTEEAAVTLTFTAQPAALNVVPYNKGITLVCAASRSDGGTVNYQWYKSADGSAPGSAVEGATGATFTTPAVTEKGVSYYYCVASAGTDASAFSTVASVAYTGLPVVYVETGDTATGDITKEAYVLGSFKLISETYGTTEYTFSKVKNGVAKEGIKGRGNSTWGMPKKGYNLKFDIKQSFFGLPLAKKWCIIANYSDKTLLRNKFASVLGTEVFDSEWNPSYISVELVLNGEYMGNYTLAEKISLTDGRIAVQDISDVEEKIAAGNTSKLTDANGDGVLDLQDGGFILEVDARLDADFSFTTTNGVPFTLKDPDEVSSDIQDRVKEVVQTAEKVLYADDFADSDAGWRAYIDEDSVIDWFLVNEFCKNNDAIFFSSVYMYFNPADGKLHLGPNWDFDISCGNIDYNGCDDPTGWWIKNARWISRLFEDPAFVSALQARWTETQSAVYACVNERIASLGSENADSADFNFKKWPILGTYVWPNAAGYESRTTYQSELSYMIDWCNSRYTWLTSAISAL